MVIEDRRKRIPVMAESDVRLIFVDGIGAARREVEKIGADPGALPWILPKSVHMLIKVTDVTPYIANILKQEMLGKGGDAAVNRGVADFSAERSDVLLMGTASQYKRLVSKLEIQSPGLIRISSMIRDVLSSLEMTEPKVYRCGRFRFPIGLKTYIMAIVNATPDSFSDGGMYNDPDKALIRIEGLISDGADIIDIGGESTRPGHVPVSDGEELERVIPIVERAVKEFDVPISIDTTKFTVAQQALGAGASIVNDIWGLQGDSRLAHLAAESGAGVVMMHNRCDRDYTGEIMQAVISFLRRGLSIAENAGLDRNRILIDPGIGFGKTFDQNLDVMCRLRELKTLGLPVLIGTSRKSVIGNVLGTQTDDRIEGTAATVALSVAYGADFVRVHDVREMARVCKMSDAIIRR